MKKIVLELAFCQKNKVTIHLGNCEWLEFKSITYANEFLRKYKKVLTNNIRNLNTMNMQIYNLYRTFYFEFDIQTNRKILKNLQLFNFSFDQIFIQYSSGNQNGFVFASVEACFKYNSDSLYYILDFANKYKNYSLINQSKSIFEMLNHLEKKFESDKKKLTPVIEKPVLNLINKKQTA